jgi:hypothetical protein
MILLAFCIGAYSLYHGYKRHHHSFVPFLVFTAGFIFLVLKQIFHLYENWLLIPAVILIVSAHWINYRDCRKADHCHTEDCNH